MKCTLYAADVTGVASNCLYPHRHEIDTPEKLAEVVAYDTVCGHFRNDYRNGDNFLGCDCVMLDCDNDHSEDEAEWMYPEKLSAEIPDVAFAAVPSRNNMKEKKGKKPRSKHHYIFPIPESADKDRVAALKAGIQEKFPFFDANALDATRFAFGAKCDPAEVFWQDGWLTIDEIVEPAENLEDVLPGKPVSTIPKGQRNQYLSRFAGRILKRYGECERAYRIFLEQADKCEEPLSERELKTIWGSAVKFFREKVVPSGNYVDPGDYNGKAGYLKPEDFSDIGQAKMLVREYGDELVYTVATDYLRYDGRVWNESKQQAVGAMEEFLDLQLADALVLCGETKQACLDAGFDPESVGKRDIANLSDSQTALLGAYLDARKYYAFVMKRRDMKYVMSALQAAKPMLEVKVSDLDSDPNLLNTPSGTLDLRYGVESMRQHDPRDLITKITRCSPSDEGKELWEEQLDKTFLGCRDVIEYHQLSTGEHSFGEVKNESMEIAYGGGRNGKSTQYNAIGTVLGDYAGTISADALTVGCRRNVKPEIAEIKGKRLLIAGELEEGMRLSTSIVKQLCSTDRIKGEKKFKDPFDFVPTHSLVLFTNHLPQVGAMDTGIWRRLVVVPFNAKFEGEAEIKNYTNYLVEHAGGYILKWIIEGAKKAYEMDFKYEEPQEVKDAVAKYRGDNDWLGDFINECCEVGEDCEEKSGDFYNCYREFCRQRGEYTRDSATFYSAIETKGLKRKRKNSGRFILGIRLTDDARDTYVGLL